MSVVASAARSIPSAMIVMWLSRAKEMFTWESVADTLSGVYARVARIDVADEGEPYVNDNARLAAGGAST